MRSTYFKKEGSPKLQVLMSFFNHTYMIPPLSGLNDMEVKSAVLFSALVPLGVAVS